MVRSLPVGLNGSYLLQLAVKYISGKVSYNQSIKATWNSPVAFSGGHCTPRLFLTLSKDKNQNIASHFSIFVACVRQR